MTYDKKDSPLTNKPGSDDRDKWGRENERDNPGQTSKGQENSPKEAYASGAKTAQGSQGVGASRTPASVKGVPGGQGQHRDPSEHSGTDSPSGSGMSPGCAGTQGTGKPRDGQGKPQQGSKGDCSSSDKPAASTPSGQKARDAKPDRREMTNEGNTGVSGETDDQAGQPRK